ncbi:MAG: NAD(P)/FAD-dependent oxidoreductase [Actinomycetia bacterium]|nr:NAD(P)/FAD-dependent oxidoreductase [Actinomycetes bacterium]
MDSQAMVVIGGGLAAAKAVEAARISGYDGRIVLFGEETHAPYERPALSKEYLRGETDQAQITVHDEAFYAEHRIDVRTGTSVVAIDRTNHEVLTDHDELVSYSQLLIASGAAPRTLRVPGAELGGVHYLRTIDDADRLRTALLGAARVVVVGGGWIGSEVAASARQLGRPVTLVDPGPAPLHTVLGLEVAAVYRDLHADHGVELALGTHVEALRGTTTVEEVVTADGRVIPADVVVVGVGVIPRTELAHAAGLTLDDGIAVDEHLRTADAAIFAAGDVAAATHPFYGRRLRVEHWANAQQQGIVAGRNIVGHRDPYDRLPYFFSDQYDVGMEYVGHAHDWDRVVLRGDPADRKFIAFWIKRDRIVAAMNVNIWDVVEPLRHLITARLPVDDARLRDPDVALDEMLTPAVG